MAMNTIIVDDERPARDELGFLLKALPEVNVIAQGKNGLEAVALIKEHEPDLVFLDVQMPELDGFGVVREWGVERMPPVIFVTAYDEFALRAFSVHAIDYLLKPVTSERFAETMAYTRRRIDETQNGVMARRLAALVADAGSKPVRRLAVRIGNRDILVPCDDIQCIRSDDVYARVSVGAREYVIRESLASIARRLDPVRFIRIHRTAIVNSAYVRELKTLPNGERVAVLAAGAVLPIGRRRREEVERALLGSLP
jgi:two-component system, LytTR family, response regulator